MNRGPDKLVVFGTLLAGVGTAVGIAMLAQGRQKDVFPFAVATTIAMAAISAARLAGGPKEGSR